MDTLTLIMALDLHPVAALDGRSLAITGAAERWRQITEGA